jgi:hypothetical protein
MLIDGASRGNTSTASSPSFPCSSATHIPRASPYSRVPSYHHLHTLLDQLTQDSSRPMQVRRLVCPEFKSPQRHLELTADLESVRIAISNGRWDLLGRKSAGAGQRASRPPGIRAPPPFLMSASRSKDAVMIDRRSYHSP